MFGQPGFFTPRTLQDWFSPGKLISYYDTSALKGTLERLVDFDRINNAREMRLSVGAVNVRTGQFAYFDSATITIRPEHVMASGALPPGFPPVEIDGEHYWDGGLFSNTPLQYVLDYSPRRSRLTFQVDVFQAQGRLPSNLDEVNERDKDIRYSSRTQICSNAFRERHDVRHAINELHKLLPPDLANTEQAKRLYEHGCVTEMDIMQLVYRPIEPQGASKDYEFSRSSMEGAVAAGDFRRAYRLACLAMARADAKGVGRACVRCNVTFSSEIISRRPHEANRSRGRRSDEWDRAPCQSLMLSVE